MERSDGNQDVLPRPESPITAHLVGVDAVATAGLARWLVAGGFAVAEALKGATRPVGPRLRVDGAHVSASRPRSSGLLVYAPDVPREHPDRLIARRDGIPEASSTDVIRWLLARGVGIAVAGRRRGRMATAMIGWTLARAGLDPTILLGAGSPQIGGPARPGDGPHVVVDVSDVPEALLSGPPGPRLAVLLDDDRLSAGGALGLVVDCVGPGGLVLLATGPGGWAGSDDVGNPRVESLSLERGSRWWGADLRSDRGRFRFRAFHRGRFAAEIRLRVPGRSSVLPALAAVAACGRLDVPAREITRALEDFEGVSRGFESRGSYRGVTLVDDDASDRDDLAEALDLARSIHGRRRIWAVYAPAGPPSRATASAFLAADRVTILGGPVDSGPWASMLEAAGVDARGASGLAEVVSDLDRHLEPGDVLLTLGAGDVGTIADEFLRRLPRDRQGR